jgi:rubrerythrin
MSVKPAQAVRDEIRPPAHALPLHPQKPAVKRQSSHRIGSAGALYSHALAITHEAIAGYREFATHASDHGNDEIADLYRRLWQLETERAFHLETLAVGIALPKLAPGAYAWLHNASLRTEARDFIFRMLTPRQTLEIAVRAEQRATAYFAHALGASNDAGVRGLAIKLRRDEGSHIAWLQDALARVPEPFRPSEECPGDPATPQAL